MLFVNNELHSAFILWEDEFNPTDLQRALSRINARVHSIQVHTGNNEKAIYISRSRVTQVQALKHYNNIPHNPFWKEVV
jgi:hypothetical protein